jgi:gliding motility-associated-like protein
MNFKLINLFVFISVILLYKQTNAQCISCTSTDTINSGLVWCHNFSGNVIDATGHGFNGSYNGTTYVNDRFGNINSAVAFNGSSNCYIEIGQNLSDMTSFSISFWVKQNGTSIAGGLIWEGDNSCGKDNYVDMGNQQITSSKQNSTLASANVNLSVPSTGWVHFVWTASPTQSKIYKNGVLVNTINLGSSWVGNHHTPTYGCWNDGNGGVCGFPKSYFYVGLLDDVRLYNRVLTATEASFLYNLNTNPISVSAGLDKTICKGDSLVLNGSSSSGANIIWSPNYKIDIINSLTPKVYPDSTINYIMRASNGSCTFYDTVKVIVNNIISDAGSDKFICKGNAVQLNGFQSLNANYFWTPNINIDNVYLPNPTVNPITTQKYILKTTINSCSKFDTVEVFVSSSFSYANQDQTICLGDSTQLIGYYSGTSYTWLDEFNNFLDSSNLVIWAKPIVNAKYILKVKSNYNCFVFDTVLIQVASSTLCNAGFDIYKCIDDTVNLNGTSNVSANIWLNNNFMSNPTNLNTSIWSKKNEKYILKSGNGNCVAFDTVEVFVKNKPTLNMDSIAYICQNENYQVNLTSSGANWFLWNPNEALNNIRIANPVLNPSKPTRYTVIIKDSMDNCPIQADLQINISKPKSIFTALPLNGIVPFSVNTNNSSLGGNQYYWKMGNKLIDNNFNAKIEFKDSGDYIISLIVIDSIGCADTSSLNIKSIAKGSLFIPNVFTPNGDDVNDQFEVSYTQNYFSHLNMKIYNRWGQQLYETSSPNIIWWDGNYLSNPCSSGVYFYILEATNIINETNKYHGTVTLLR